MRGDTIKKIREEEMILEESEFDEENITKGVEDDEIYNPGEGGFMIGFHSDREY